VLKNRKVYVKKVVETKAYLRYIGYIPLFLLLLSGCSINKFAINKLGDALAESGTTFASDEDPDLVAQAVPFSLKLIESLLSSSPEHRGLLLAAASGFTQYSYAFVHQQADFLEDEDFQEATRQRTRARKLYLRARDYGIRGLETRYRDFGARLRTDPLQAVRVITARDVPMLYWTAAAWGAAISISKEIPELVADQLLVEALIDRALELEEDFNYGSIHGFLISYESSRQGASGEATERARRHFDRVVELTGGNAASPFVALAEAVSVGEQNRQEFEDLLNRALQVDPDEMTEWRLENLVMQQRARWLLDRIDDLFLEPLEPLDVR